ncbi:MAG TPA: copper chaperone PCu(A)C [Usitatibacter sp.]|nr:copper chaperone PCu(A)C [Usitatibacter sp.]
MKWLGMVASLCAFAANAAVTATDAWVRGTVPAQKTTGAFVTLQSSEEAKLVGVSTPLAKSAEIHESSESQGVVHMHAIEAIRLPAGQRVELKPGGFHVMLVDLSRPLGEGDQVPLTFTIEDAHGKRTQIELRAPVRPLGQ